MRIRAHVAQRDRSDAMRCVGYQPKLISHSAEFRKRTGPHLLHRPAAMHLHRGFGDAAIVGNLFAQAAARHLNGNWWKWTTLCGPLRVPRKCMNPFWMPAMNYTSEVESNASTASLLRQSRQPCWAASRADRRAIMDAVMRQIGQGEAHR